MNRKREANARKSQRHDNILKPLPDALFRYHIHRLKNIKDVVFLPQASRRFSRFGICVYLVLWLILSSR